MWNNIGFLSGQPLRGLSVFANDDERTQFLQIITKAVGEGGGV